MNKSDFFCLFGGRGVMKILLWCLSWESVNSLGKMS